MTNSPCEMRPGKESFNCVHHLGTDICLARASHRENWSLDPHAAEKSGPIQPVTVWL